MEHVIDRNILDEFRRQLAASEKSKATIDKYLRDVKTFITFVGDHLLSHSNSFSFEMEKDTAGCRAFNRNFIVGGVNVF